jgi:hypothetical protein
MTTNHARAPHAADPLRQMLHQGRAPSLDWLLALSPDEPLAELEPDESGKMKRVRGVGWTVVPRTLRKSDWALAEKFPGLQLSYRKLEHMKYGNTPPDGAPLSEFVRARISHAKALWSRDVSAGWTRLQFRDWLPLHIGGKFWMPPLWADWSGGWAEALQVLRIACGLPRFAPTETWKLRPPPVRVSRRSRS